MSATESFETTGCTSYATDIRPKFTTEDVEHMNGMGLDLNDYTTVSGNADLILSRLTDAGNPMPPEPRGPWPSDWIECFKDWIANGKQP